MLEAAKKILTALMDAHQNFDKMITVCSKFLLVRQFICQNVLDLIPCSFHFFEYGVLYLNYQVLSTTNQTDIYGKYIFNSISQSITNIQELTKKTCLSNKVTSTKGEEKRCIWITIYKTFYSGGHLVVPSV